MISEFIKKCGAKKLILGTSDLVCVLLSAFISLYTTSHEEFSLYINSSTIIETLAVFLIGCLMIIPIFRYYQLYKHKYFLQVGEQTLLILKGLLIDSIFIILLIFLVKTQETLHDSRTQVIIYFSTSMLLLFVSRVLILRRFLRANYIGGNIKEILTCPVLAVGAGSLGEFFAEILTVKPHYHIELVAFVDDEPGKANKKINRIPVLGTTDDIDKIVEDQEIDEIF